MYTFPTFYSGTLMKQSAKELQPNLHYIRVWPKITLPSKTDYVTLHHLHAISIWIRTMKRHFMIPGLYVRLC